MTLAEIITGIRNATRLYEVKRSWIADAFQFLKTGVESAVEDAESALDAAGGAVTLATSANEAAQAASTAIDSLTGVLDLDNTVNDLHIDLSASPDLMVLDATVNVNITFAGVVNCRKSLFIKSNGFSVAFQNADYDYGDFSNNTLVEITVINDFIVINKLALS